MLTPISPSSASPSDFRPLREQELPHFRAVAREFEHTPSGARLLHLACDDPENCFALIFPTPPDADTGVPHILEHAVLAGSEKYPVREPFFELIKSSPAGFINAMTAETWTIYPICTTLEGDFWNLAEVYTDAVFHPNLSRDTFEREGHHLELEQPGDLESALVRSGIVYNEMKGAYSNTEMVIRWRLKKELFPGGSLGFDSGGDPREIPRLTFEGLREFYGRFYAPGNCLLFLYGNIPTEKHLAYWGEKLSAHGKAPSLAARPLVPMWDAPRELDETYPVEPDGDLKQRTYLSLRWHAGDGLDSFEELAWDVLARLLSGHDGAPLKKALIDSKLGADVLVCGCETVQSERTFHVAIKGSEPERAAEFETFVLQTLEEIATAGFDREAVETAVRQMAYESLEVSSLFPLRIGMDVARYATNGGDPLEATRSREMLEKVHAVSDTEADFWTRRIREGLLGNPHRLRITFRPDPEHAAREDEREKAELAALRATLSPDELRTIDERAQSRKAAQDEPNSPEALATLPRLKKDDLPDVPREFPTTEEEVAGFPLLRHDVFSNGVVYLQAAVDVHDLPPHLWKFLPRYTDAFAKLGAAGQSWEQIAARRAAATGGLNSWSNAMLHAGSGAPVVDLNFSLKTLDSDVDAALDLWADLMFGLDPHDKERLHEMQTQGTAWYRDRLVNSAIHTALLAAGRSQSSVGWLRYLWTSPLTYSWMRHLTDGFESHSGELMQGIDEVRDWLLDPTRWTWSFTGSDEAFSRVQRHLGEWRDRMKHQGSGSGRMDSASNGIKSQPQPGTGEWDGALQLPTHLGLAAPIEVQFCTRAFPAPPPETQPLVQLGLGAMRFDHFLPEIRLKGNAYGGDCGLDTSGGVMQFYSYRDPRLSETLGVFDAARDWVVAQHWSEDDLERVLLGDVGDAVPAIRPFEATYFGLHRFRRGETADMRAADYHRKLGASPNEVKAVLVDYLDDVWPRATTAVAASRVALERANTELKEAGREPLVIEEMLPDSAT